MLAAKDPDRKCTARPRRLDVRVTSLARTKLSGANSLSPIEAGSNQRVHGVETERGRPKCGSYGMA